ncbi:SRPBCC domain-containing protein [Gordonia sp. HY002]|uniref:SRPBCC family protein n=1 Tax=Gordonia zhenghanii TaxID=2911516 RepID=UPI001EEFAF4D|nr:SRPBCC domain-containing protein [Gordonia zhenghanii]MCF8570534.1 SRPBCC domain-containing protein [Gordonia zhenghanii]MCF8602509.1 SRPBCC domain-containing protein [Gordonia zhenghanii]
MPVIDVTTDTDNLTLTITAQFAAPVERVWEIYADPRQLEKIWGPPTYPATFVEHDFTPGGRATYYMTSPEGDKFGGWWEFLAVDPPSSFTFRDGFADADLNPDDSMPVGENHYAFSAADGGTRAVYTATFSSADALQQVLDMGVVEGSSSAINQIDELLAA